MQTLVSLFKKSVKKFSKRPIFSMRPRWRLIHWTFAELYNFSSGIAEILEQNKVKKQDKVILISTNSPMWGGSFFGVLLKGAIVVPLNPQSTNDFVKKIISETGAKVILKSSLIKFEDIKIPIIDIDLLLGLEKKKHIFKENDVNPEDIAEIVYTSGTTGDPKGVILTHNNIMFDIESVTKVFKPNSNDKIVSILPLFHMYEQTGGLFSSIKYGLEVMYSPSVSSLAIMATLQEQQATKMLVVPEVLETILRNIESKAMEAGKERMLEKMFSIAVKLPYFLRRILFKKVHKSLGGRLRILACGGAALHEDIEKKWRAMGFEIYQGYGLTETSPVLTTNVPGHYRIGSVGRVIPGVTVTFGDNDEILASGPNIFSGYYKDPKRTKEAFDKQGRFKTGDIGYFDKDGFLYISGRAKYMIVSPSGENIYPEDLEEELIKIEGVKDAAVVGIEVNHHVLIQAVLLGNIKDPEAVIEQANKNLASYQKIQDWSLWPEEDFPRSATRKVKKEEVIKWIKSKGKEKYVVVTNISPLISLLASVSGKNASKINDNTKFYRDLHFDSLMKIELVSRIEESMGSFIEEQSIKNTTTVKELEELIAKGKQDIKREKFKSWLFSWPAITIREFLLNFIVFPLYRLRMKVKVVGLKNIQNLDLPVVFTSNHISYIDSLIILRALPSKIRRMVAIAAALDVLYQHYWWAARFIEFMFNSYPLPRREEDNIRPGLEYTGKILDRNFSVLIFPEGKISNSGKLLEFKKGIGLIATEMHLPVVPIVIQGINKIVPEDKIWPRKTGVINVRIGKPIKFEPEASFEKVTSQIRDATLALMR